jgi:acyl-CoA synthetase (AMP-forming)/AMP-acid ligase II
MIFRAPEPALTIPEIGLTQFLLDRVPGREERAALIDGPTGRTLTYGGWAAGVRRVAAALAARGFTKGDVFGIYSPNLPEYAVIFHAVSLIGGVNTTINPLYTPAEAAQQLRDCAAK